MNYFEPQLFEKLKSVGRDVRIGDFVKIVFPENLEIGNHVIIDDFTFIYPGKASRIGDHVHIASFCCISGGGVFSMEDFSGLSGRVTVYTGSDDFSGRCLTNPTVPRRYRAAARIDQVTIGKHAIVGAGAIILPGVHLGEGCAVGAMSLVTRSVKPWTIVAGNPARQVNIRRRDIIERMEKDLRASEQEPP